MNEALFLKVYLADQMKKDTKSFKIQVVNQFFIVLLDEEKQAWISLSLL